MALTVTGQINQSTISALNNCDVESGKVDDCVEWGKCPGTKQLIQRETVYKREQNEKCGFDMECCPSSLYNPEDSLGENCGVRISSGLAQAFGEFPWMVAILKEFKMNGTLYYVYMGGGSIINPRVVLTAANVRGLQMDLDSVKSLWARAGDMDLHSNSEYPPHQDRAVSRVIKHEQYDLSKLKNNIAILILAEPFVQAGNVQMVCLPLPTDVAADGTDCIASSWGSKPSVLKKVVQPVVGRETCKNYVQQMGTKISQLDDSLMCAGGREGTEDCQVDIGSPLVCSVFGDPERYIQFGILARSLECNRLAPNLYTALTSVRQWIDDTLRAFTINSMSYTYVYNRPA